MIHLKAFLKGYVFSLKNVNRRAWCYKGRKFQSNLLQVTLVTGSEENSIHNADISKLWKEEMVTQFVGAHSCCNVQYRISQFKKPPSPHPP